MAFAYQLIRTYNIKLKINWLKKASPEGSTILDYGCGTGDFLAAVKRTDWICEGLESNPKAQNIAAKKGLSVYLDHSAVSAKLYDVICLWHVFEHLENPRQIKQWLYNHLSSPGVLIIAVPNFNSWEAKYYGEHWAAYDVPRHLWHFSQESIKAIFEPDFEVFEQHSMWFDAFYISLLSEQYKSGRSNPLIAFLIASWSNIRAIFTREPSSVTYVLRKR